MYARVSQESEGGKSSEPVDEQQAGHLCVARASTVLSALRMLRGTRL